jgi:lipoyl(octanoyl) transferase
VTIGRQEVLVHVRRGDEFLVARRAIEGYWHVVSGGVEPGEEPEAAAARELLEETGLRAEALREIGGFDYAREAWEPDPGMHCSVRAFVADAPPGWEPQLDDEHDEYRWCGADDACALLYWPEPRNLLRTAVETA